MPEAICGAPGWIVATRAPSRSSTKSPIIDRTINKSTVIPLLRTAAVARR